MILSLIYAVADNRVIGKGGKLPWRLPDDFKHFKATTLGRPVIMGRATFETDAGLLPDRPNIVLSRDEDARLLAMAKGAHAAASLEDALAPYQGTDEEVFIIGGASVYADAFPLCHRIYETCVRAAPEGDTRLPKFDLSGFTLKEERHHSADDKHAFPFDIKVWERK